MDSDPVRRQGPERDNAEGEVVLGASPPARLFGGQPGRWAGEKEDDLSALPHDLSALPPGQTHHSLQPPMGSRLADRWLALRTELAQRERRMP